MTLFRPSGANIFLFIAVRGLYPLLYTNGLSGLKVSEINSILD